MPIVLDNNRQGAVSDYLKKNSIKNSYIDIVSPIFTIYAFEELREMLKQSNKVRFLFNEPTFIRKIQNNQKEVKEFQIQMSQRERNVSEFPLEINLKNNLDQNQVAVLCYDFIKNKAEVKSVTQSRTVNTNNYHVRNSDNPFLISGDNIGFSMDGLGYTNRLSFNFNTVLSDKETLDKYETFFNEIWSDPKLVEDVKETLLDHITNLYKENSPELVYYLTLYNLFGEKLNNMDEMVKIKERTGINKTKIWSTLYNFQHDAVIGAIKKLELYNGCIIADSVGLGKTFEALAVIKYYELRNARVMVLAPKKLRANWVGFKQNTLVNPLLEDRFNYDVLYHTDLSRIGGYSGEIDLAKLNWGNYDLVVIDESHNFRNNPAVIGRQTRYQKLMQDIIKSGVKTKILMLSATPVNNGLTDLGNQIMFITEDRDDAFKDTLGISSIKDTLRVAQTRFNEWNELKKVDQSTEGLQKSLDFNFYNLLNTVTIARSRKHIQKYYDTKDIGDFPVRLKPVSLVSDIDLKNRFPKLVDINNDILRLNLAIYSPILYVLPTKFDEYEKEYGQVVKDGKGSFKQSDRERNLVNLMRVNILKRLESSVFSFKLTLGRILTQVEQTIEMVDKHRDINADQELIEIDDEEIDDLEIGKSVKVKLKDIDLIRYKSDLEDDKEILRKLLHMASNVSSKDDAKLEMLTKQIIHKINNPINGANKKIIIFTAFSDTAEYLYEHLASYMLKNHNLYSGIITGSGKLETNVPKARNGFEDILALFSPVSNKMLNFKNEVDILIATDCISEGQNLQDCDYLINYDIHWNPVRIIQRFGRIDRIGSKNRQIQLVNFWPNMELDEYIKLEARVRGRMVMVDLSATGEDDLLNPVSKDLKYRSEQLKQLQNEVVDLEDLSGGISITDLTLDDFLMALDRFIKDHPGLLESYPTGVYAVVNAPEKLRGEAVPGVIFCLKQRKFNDSKVGENSLYPYHLVYVKKDGSIAIDHVNPKTILDILKTISSGKTEPIKALVDLFNKKTKNGSQMDDYTELLGKGVLDIQGAVQESGIKSIFKLGKTDLLENKISGIDDFELISFMVIE